MSFVTKKKITIRDNWVEARKNYDTIFEHLHAATTFLEDPNYQMNSQEKKNYLLQELN